MYKFRTMYTTTPDCMPTYLLLDPDKCITPIGRFLRATSIDELPQLLNIFKGEMSFIGPRPVVPFETELNELRMAYGVFQIRPGITGFAQINGRDRVKVREKILLDKYYQKHLSFSLDLWIFCLTIRKVLTKKDVYEGNDIDFKSNINEESIKTA